MIAFIALGSNMGDRNKYLEDAITLINKRVGNVLKRSSILETEPYGYTDQDNFLNMAIKVETELSPRDLLKELLQIEAELERVRLITWGPRTIDLDIIYYDNEIIDEADLKIPHIDLYNRDFVLKPIVEIDENFIDPRKNKKVRELLEELENKE
ncbi:MAG: 2-amino-4-hydroxy-6-hydroxymethyldihydropteridine diphosphokinase [Miniphocaeibacter sp.]|uniref:2-amino-4-hydroxy-6- hydroxymethyldihydropteridine diphosphokinase n=1 Tax=Miniphocaeibacter sp. TaxID=3100973 RepID=UPI00185D6632|nr:2-amino-4-hydroxy-6-hydroxymethyldihydropteridine diphosphokinase [Gallicola sp.]